VAKKKTKRLLLLCVCGVSGTESLGNDRKKGYRSNPQEQQSGDALLIHAQDRAYEESNRLSSTLDFSLWGSACSEYCVIRQL